MPQCVSSSCSEDLLDVVKNLVVLLIFCRKEQVSCISCIGKGSAHFAGSEIVVGGVDCLPCLLPSLKSSTVSNLSCLLPRVLLSHSHCST